MKTKVIKIALVLFLAFGLVFATAPSTVFAGTVPATGPAPSWVVTPAIKWKSEIPMYLVTTPAPPDQQLSSDGLEISSRAKICFPFRGGQFGWIGQIRMLNGTKWLPLTTTTAWVPTIEGSIWACANAPAAGTYALFAYWQPLQ
jgi:hypothetical protein